MKGPCLCLRRSPLSRENSACKGPVCDKYLLEFLLCFCWKQLSEVSPVRTWSAEIADVHRHALQPDSFDINVAISQLWGQVGGGFKGGRVFVDTCTQVTYV